MQRVSTMPSPSLALALLSLGVCYASTDQPNFSGRWALDPTKSQDTNGAAVELTIQDASGKIDYQRVVRERGGKEIKASFTCPTRGTWCKFDENGHLGKVSLWYDGSALMMAKEGGPSKDATTERRMELSPDGKTLTVEFTNFSGSGKPQKLVFTKQ